MLGTIRLTGVPWLPLHLFVIFSLEEKISAVEVESQDLNDVLCCEFCPLV